MVTSVPPLMLPDEGSTLEIKASLVTVNGVSEWALPIYVNKCQMTITKLQSSQL